MTRLTVAATQMACSWDQEENLAQAESLVREAAGQGAQVILIQELFATPYFCIEQHYDHLKLASPRDQSPVIAHMAKLAKDLGVVLPTSWFEREGNAFFNSLAMIDGDGAVMGVYRKSHIPNAIGYQEKHYFSPGDTGFKVWETGFGKIGVGICWDQWFPEAARCMALAGAELLMYPTAIGSEPETPGLNSATHWQNTMCGHAAANIMPLVASNRIGRERALHDQNFEMTFYGSSFIANHKGEKVAEANDHDRTVLVASFDREEVRDYRDTWGIYRDRRPDLYGAIATLDGRTD